MFSGYMENKYSLDIIASLLQIAYGPRLNTAGPEIPAEHKKSAEQALQWIGEKFVLCLQCFFIMLA